MFFADVVFIACLVDRFAWRKVLAPLEKRALSGWLDD